MAVDQNPDAEPGADEPARPEAAAADAPIDADFEPASGASAAGAHSEADARSGLFSRIRMPEVVTFPIILALAAGSAVLGGVLGVVLDSGGGAPAGVEKRVDELEGRLRQIAEAAGAEGGAGSAAVAAALAEFEIQLDGVAKASEAAGKRLAALERAGPSRGDGPLIPDERIGKLESDIAEARRLAEGANAAIAALTGRVDGLSDIVKNYGSELKAAGVAASEIASQITGVAPPKRGGAGAQLAIYALAEAVRQGRGFAAELARLKAYIGETPELVALAAHAENGAPTVLDLRERYRAVSRAARDAERGKGGGLADRVGEAVAGIVTVRRLDAPVTDATGDITARAAAKLAASDFSGALAEMERLKGPAREAAEPWIADARARLAVDAGLDALQRSLANG